MKKGVGFSELMKIIAILVMIIIVYLIINGILKNAFQ